MKVISVMQPWATLIVLGEKKFETRSWKTKHRGVLAIHASKKIDKEACQQESIQSVLQKHGYSIETLPIGAILATCTLTDCLEVTKLITSNDSEYAIAGVNDTKIEGNEYEFGWYDLGRFAWELQDVKKIETPIPAKGQLNLWNYDSKIS